MNVFRFLIIILLVNWLILMEINQIEIIAWLWRITLDWFIGFEFSKNIFLVERQGCLLHCVVCVLIVVFWHLFDCLRLFYNLFCDRNLFDRLLLLLWLCDWNSFFKFSQRVKILAWIGILSLDIFIKDVFLDFGQWWIDIRFSWIYYENYTLLGIEDNYFSQY